MPFARNGFNGIPKMIVFMLPFLFKYTFNLQLAKQAKAINTSRLRASELVHVEYKDENYVVVIALVALSARKKRHARGTTCLSSKKLSNKSLSKFDLRSCGALLSFGDGVARERCLNCSKTVP
ncbi:hypothetical protein GOP47_0017315 [Adiantum capillus-veneris]|uniref:Uncharacterized protein n=1 Tax=Adiantum capillus-veneris TaxID=13818 RepID=A0A9D4ZAG7_ADICA|nr:hypothetical protein GOP47_0017315 [Adiantum capillus-veneris]